MKKFFEITPVQAGIVAAYMALNIYLVLTFLLSI